jgi:hypothetical protein
LKDNIWNLKGQWRKSRVLEEIDALAGEKLTK